ncbi:MAG: hypothetical protein OEY20_14095 [Gemmatimonadota bacterium]|nr:hypothetical protein [Gemmatimonadota bacterium]
MGGFAILILPSLWSSTAPTSYAEGLLALLVAVIVLPVAGLVGLIELVLAWRGGRTALALVATVAGALGRLIAVPLVVFSMHSVARGGDWATWAGGFFFIVIGLATASVVQVAAAVHVLEGRSRLIPIVVVVGAVVVGLAGAGVGLAPVVALAALVGLAAVVGLAAGQRHNSSRTPHPPR